MACPRSPSERCPQPSFQGLGPVPRLSRGPVHVRIPIREDLGLAFLPRFLPLLCLPASLPASGGPGFSAPPSAQAQDGPRPCWGAGAEATPSATTRPAQPSRHRAVRTFYYVNKDPRTRGEAFMGGARGSTPCTPRGSGGGGGQWLPPSVQMSLSESQGAGPPGQEVVSRR